MKFWTIALFVFSSSSVWAQLLEEGERPYSEQFLVRINEISKGFFMKPKIEHPSVVPWSTVENYDFGKDRGSITMINDLRALHPFFRDRVIQLISECRKKGIEVSVVETYRTTAKQNEYKSMGRKFTRSTGGSSKHQYGLAVDLVPMIGDSAQWHDDKLWRKIGVIGERLGLRWGGRWRHPYDPGHFEWTGGLTSTLLASGLMPIIPNALNDYPCLEHDIEQLRVEWKNWEVNQSVVAREKSLSTGHK